MTLEIIISATGSLVLLTMVAATVRRRKKLKELRNLLEFSQKQIEDLQDSIVRVRESGDTALQRATEQARRIAWLETRIRKPREHTDEVLDETILTEGNKLSMTERRHRVITLANRGKDLESIASALGLFKGEVELILSLNNAATSGR